MMILGPLLHLDDPDAVIWMRSFPSLEERDHLTKEFYEGPEWISGLDEVAMPMLDRYEVVVTQATPGALAGSLTHNG